MTLLAEIGLGLTASCIGGTRARGAAPSALNSIAWQRITLRTVVCDTQHPHNLFDLPLLLEISPSYLTDQVHAIYLPTPFPDKGRKADTQR